MGNEKQGVRISELPTATELLDYDMIPIVQDGVNKTITGNKIKGNVGKGVPLGGTTNQLLKKVSDVDYDTAWVDSYSIGSIIITDNNINLAMKLGGTWSLVFKKCNRKTYSCNQDTSATESFFIRNTTNVANTWNLVINIDNNVASIRFNYTNAVAIADTTLNLGALDMNKLGFTQLSVAQYVVGMSDAGNGVTMNYVSNTGSFETRDVITKTSNGNIPANSGSNFLQFTVPIFWQHIKDDICDEWNWEKIA